MFCFKKFYLISIEKELSITSRTRLFHQYTLFIFVLYLYTLFEFENVHHSPSRSNYISGCCTGIYGYVYRSLFLKLYFFLRQIVFYKDSSNVPTSNLSKGFYLKYFGNIEQKQINSYKTYFRTQSFMFKISFND